METLNKPIHAGEVLEDVLTSREISKTDFANSIGITDEQINDFLDGKVIMTKDFATKLADFFGTSVDMWLGL